MTVAEAIHDLIEAARAEQSRARLNEWLMDGLLALMSLCFIAVIAMAICVCVRAAR